MKRLPVLR